MKKKIFVVAAILTSSQLIGQEDSTSKTLDEVVISTNKYPKKQTETGKVVTIITRQQLERSGGKSLGEILNGSVGVNVLGANNNPGTNLRTSIRGSSDGNVLILVDGIPVNDPSVLTNYFDLNFFTVEQVERIEILKGGQSTLYGSDAVAGVINIITRKIPEKHFGLNAGINGGSYNTFKENIGINGNGKFLNYNLQYTHLGSDGFSTAHDSAGNKNFDKDGFNQHAVSTDLIFKLSPKLRAKVLSSYSYYKTDLDASAFTDEKDFTASTKNIQAGTGLIYDHNKGSFHFNYHFNYVSRDYVDDSVHRSSPFLDYSKSIYIGRTNFAEIYNNWKWKGWELLTGIDYRLNNTYQYSLFVFPGFPFPPSELKAKMTQISPYASLVYKIKNFTAEAGGRWNNHSEYGSNFSYTVNPSLLIDQKMKVFANLYSAFKTPTLYQLFDPYYGNPALEPEKGIIGEVGFEIFPSKKFDLRLVGFYRKSKNVIEFILTDPITFTSQYRNISRQENYGAELEISYNTQQWSLDVNYAYTDGKTRSPYDGTGFPLAKDTTYYNLYRIPKHAFNVKAGYQVTKNVFLSTMLKAVGKRFEAVYASAPVELESYYTIDIYGEYKLQSKWKFFVDLKNITDQEYFDISGYNTRRFNFSVGVGFHL